MYSVYFTDGDGTRHLLGQVIANHGMTVEEVCEFAGVKLAVTEEECALAEDPMENGVYFIEDLEIERS